MKENIIDFKQIKTTSKEVHVVIHAFPDPDSISSALGIIQILKMSDIKTGGIYYTGEISHPMNRALVTLLNITLIDYEKEPFEKGNDVIVVDCNGLGKDSNQQAITYNDANVIAIIDHHKGKNDKNIKIDYRNVGSCASIIWCYLNNLNFDFNSNEETKILATALAIGIFTDTSSLTSNNIADLDFLAYQNIINCVDRKKFTNIINFDYPSYLFELRQLAFTESNQEIHNSTIITGIGIINSLKRDAIPVIADELLRMSGITTSIVFAIVKSGDDGFLDISIRSKDSAIDASQIAKLLLMSAGSDSSGGGKIDSSRVMIPLNFFINDNEEINNTLWTLIKKLIFNKLGKMVKYE